MPPSPTIRVQAPSGQISMRLLTEGDTVIGRDAKAGLVLDDARISRRHAVITRAGGRVVLADLGSRNGTFRNGARVGDAAQALESGDVVTVGDFTLVFDPQDAILFTQDPAMSGLRAVLQKAPDELVQSGSVVDAAGQAPVAGLRTELEKKTRVLGLFYELSRTLGSVFTLGDVYDKVIAILLQVTPAARVMIFHQADRGEMRLVASGSRGQGTSRPGPAVQPLRVSRTVFDNVAQQRVSVLLASTSQADPAVPDSLQFHETHSVMAAPIVGRTGLLGVIYTDQQDVLHAFSADDLDLLNAVAVQTGIALDTVRAHDALQREAKAREKYERFLPQQLVDDVMLDPDKEIRLGGTRQTLSVLFADLRGFTTLSEANPPEVVVDLLNRFLTLMSEVIFRHGGTLDKYIGDGVLALFGAPYSTERDAVKAVRAAIDMQRAVQTLNHELIAAGQAHIGVGIGINTGPAIVGFIGSESRLDYTAIGDTVNTAARLEHLAQAGQIIIGEHTMQALDASVRYTLLDAVQVKGRSAKLQIGVVTWSAK